MAFAILPQNGHYGVTKYAIEQEITSRKENISITFLSLLVLSEQLRSCFLCGPTWSLGTVVVLVNQPQFILREVETKFCYLQRVLLRAQDRGAFILLLWIFVFIQLLSINDW